MPWMEIPHEEAAAAYDRHLAARFRPVPPAVTALHAHYFSTHCLHDHHDQCKGVCKHCTEQCRCDCHDIS